SPAYNVRSIPPVRSRHPLWEDPGLATRIIYAEEYLATAPQGKRAALCTSVVAAAPEYVMRIPHPSYLPLLMAIATAGLFVGVRISRSDVAVAGVAAVLLCALRWWWGPAPEKDSKDAGHGLHLPIELGARGSTGWLGAAAF